MLLLTRSHHEPDGKSGFVNEASASNSLLHIDRSFSSNSSGGGGNRSTAPLPTAVAGAPNGAGAAATAAALVDAELCDAEAATAATAAGGDAGAVSAAAVEFEFASGRRHSFDVSAQPAAASYRSGAALQEAVPPTAAPLGVPQGCSDVTVWRPFTRTSRFLTTSRILRLFGAGVQVSATPSPCTRCHSYSHSIALDAHTVAAAAADADTLFDNQLSVVICRHQSRLTASCTWPARGTCFTRGTSKYWSKQGSEFRLLNASQMRIAGCISCL